MSKELLIILGIAAVLTAVDALWVRYKKIQHRRRFESRVALAIGDWHSHFYGASEHDREPVEIVIRALAKDIGISPTQLSPTDSIIGDLYYAPAWLLIDSPLEAAFEEIGKFIKKRTGRRWRPGANVKTLGDLIDDVMNACSAEAKTEREPSLESALLEE